MGDALLRLDDLSVGYGGTRVVTGVDLTVDPGEAVGIVGESGSGKTTIARAIAGFITPIDGSVRWEGAPLGRRRSRSQRRAVQTVFQDPFLSLNPHRSVGSVLRELIRSLGRIPRGELDRAVDELLRQVALPASVASARPAQLSGGQRQRVAIARALAVRPRLIIADEPTSALDVSVQAGVLSLFRGLTDDLGTALIVITHDLGVVEHLCDRVVVLEHGRIVEQGPTSRVLGTPTHPYTRRLVDAVPRLPDIRSEGDSR
ncbi:ABC transporter ATP-binding protein [Microbacterium sp. 18062]|uniref:ABC transporter ATP-binding protein n=1 Tax=Microbacterium sp. 18062 TaxID=2681410 RepID=UPI00135B96EF|nr:ABC transporter ATP-binding protein [Microbacterium sp. 18062]